MENTYRPHRDRDTALEATLEYAAENWETHLEYEVPVHPELEDPKFEWEYEYKWRFDRSTFSLQHELDRNLEINRTRAELTPRYYYKESKNLRLGFDLKIDYYNSLREDSLDLNEVEIEPTIIYTKLIGKGRFYSELEFPKLRLYAKEDLVDDFKFTGYELILRYRQNMTDKTRLLLELKVPYNAEVGEHRYQPNIGIRHYF